MKLLIAKKVRLDYAGQMPMGVPPMQGVHDGSITLPILGGDGRDGIRCEIIECAAAFEIEEGK